jgi:hypothetical protein
MREGSHWDAATSLSGSGGFVCASSGGRAVLASLGSGATRDQGFEGGEAANDDGWEVSASTQDHGEGSAMKGEGDPTYR